MLQQSTAQTFAAKDRVSEDNWIGDCTLKKINQNHRFLIRMRMERQSMSNEFVETHLCVFIFIETILCIFSYILRICI